MAATQLTGNQIRDATVSLTVDIFGILPIANGGSGQSTFPYNRQNIVSGTQNSSNKVFTVANVFFTGSLMFFENGELLLPTNDYTLSGTTITYTSSRSAPDVGDNLAAWAVY